MKKKIRIEVVLIVCGLILFFISMLSFIINACTIRNITLAWILVVAILVGCALFMSGIILYLIHNKEKIKKYLDELIK